MRKTLLGVLVAVVGLSFAGCEGQPAPLKKAEEELVNSIGMKFRLIQPGSFMMGSEDSDEKPVHKVTLTKGFYMGVYEVTQEEWEKVMGSNPSHFKGPKKPVENVSWDDAREFARKLSQKENVTYRLPTEAEWEYACRAGTTTDFYWGNAFDGRCAWNDTNSGGKTQPVGTRRPNAWGLYDMSGNVWEWCEDWYSEGYPADTQGVDPKGAASGVHRVFRGGGWSFGAFCCRSALRFGSWPSFRNRDLGSRLVRAVTDAGSEATPCPAVRAAARRDAMSFYYCTDCEKEFTADAGEVPPTKCPTCGQITAVSLRKYQCKECKTVFPGYMLKYDPATKRAIERRKKGEKVPDSEISNALLRGPDTEDWMDSSTQGAFDLIANTRCPKCEASGADIEAIFP